MASGQEPSDGSFFYKPTKEEFKEVDCHILTVSRGYRADGFQGKKDVFHQVVAGVITNDGDFKPFIMFFTGKRLSNLWEFGKEASPYSKARPVPIPMFALKVRLTTEKIKTDFGTTWIAKLTIERGMNGYPLSVTDVSVFKSLMKAVEKAEDMVASLVETKSTEVVEQSPVEGSEDLLSGTGYKEELKVEDTHVEDIEPVEIPF